MKKVIAIVVLGVFAFVLGGCDRGTEFSLPNRDQLYSVKVERHIAGNENDIIRTAAMGFRWDGELVVVLQCPCYFSDMNPAKYPAVSVESGEVPLRLLPGADYEVTISSAKGTTIWEINMDSSSK